MRDIVCRVLQFNVRCARSSARGGSGFWQSNGGCAISFAPWVARALQSKGGARYVFCKGRQSKGGVRDIVCAGAAGLLP